MAANRAHGALLHGGFGAGFFADEIRSYRMKPIFVAYAKPPPLPLAGEGAVYTALKQGLPLP